jgi:hypothetical protein
MKGCLSVFVVLAILLSVGALLPLRIIDSGVEDFEGRERRAASAAFFTVSTLYGDSSLEVLEYVGPPLVLGWHVEGVEECPPLPRGEEPREDGYRAYAGGRSARIGAYTLFGIPRGEVEVTCGGRREWRSYFLEPPQGEVRKNTAQSRSYRLRTTRSACFPRGIIRFLCTLDHKAYLYVHKKIAGIGPGPGELPRTR